MPIADPELLRRLVAAELARTQSAAPQPTQGRLSPLSQGMLIGGNAADAWTTWDALRNPHVHEANPIYGAHPGAATVAAIKAGTTLGELLLLGQLAKQHPKAANLTAKILGAGLGAVAASNWTKRGK